MWEKWKIIVLQASWISSCSMFPDWWVSVGRPQSRTGYLKVHNDKCHWRLDWTRTLAKPWADRELTHRDNVNPDQDLHRVVQRDSSTDFADSTVSSFVQVHLILLCHFIQAESSLRVHRGTLCCWRSESSRCWDDDVFNWQIRFTLNLPTNLSSVGPSSSPDLPRKSS